jgi:hypothetical protein
MNGPVAYTAMFSVLCSMVFIAAFLAGDVAGVLIEKRMNRRWKRAARKTGFEFDGSKKRYPSLS